MVSKEIRKIWSLLFPPECFGEEVFEPCTARYLDGFCPVNWECTKEIHRRKNVKWK